MNKDRHILSELNSFFAESNNTKAIQGIMNVMSHITLSAAYGFVHWRKRGKYVEENGL